MRERVSTCVRACVRALVRGVVYVLCGGVCRLYTSRVIHHLPLDLTKRAHARTWVFVRVGVCAHVWGGNVGPRMGA